MDSIISSIVVRFATADDQSLIAVSLMCLAGLAVSIGLMALGFDLSAGWV
jgi:hypothetical protein